MNILITSAGRRSYLVRYFKEVLAGLLYFFLTRKSALSYKMEEF